MNDVAVTHQPDAATHAEAGDRGDHRHRAVVHGGEGGEAPFVRADQRVEMQVEARCWCGARATNNARLVNDNVVFEGETVVVGDTATTRKEPLFGDVVRYELLCRYHYRRGQLAPNT